MGYDRSDRYPLHLLQPGYRGPESQPAERPRPSGAGLANPDDFIPLQLRGQEGLDANKVNFISLTPGTTFDLRSATGVTQERALLQHLLHDLVSHTRGLHNLLQVTAGADGWNRAVDGLDLNGVDTRIIERFRRDVQADSDLFQELERVCEMFPRRRDVYPADMT